MSAYPDILEWSTSRPMWQRDALRRMVHERQLSSQDHDELLDLCLCELQSKDFEALPLDDSHIPMLRNVSGPVHLISMRHHSGVNALAVGQDISFEPSGLTVVYGGNGSGKSGYARVLRRLCRAQEKKTEILANAFNAKPSPLHVEIHYNSSGLPEQLQWNGGDSGCLPLRQIGFFDGQCGERYIGRNIELTYKPTGIELLECLAELCVTLEKRLSQEIARLGSTRSALTIFDRETKTGATILSITAATDLAKLRQSIEPSGQELAELERQEKHLRLVEARINKERLVLMRTQESKLRAVSAILGKLETAHSENRLEHLDLMVRQHNANAKAAEIAAEKAFSDTDLVGIGEEAWRSLWAAARLYSTRVAYPNQQFPNTSKDAKCRGGNPEPSRADAIVSVSRGSGLTALD